MTHSKERYGQTCSRNEFLTHIACAMEIGGELHENLSDRMDELIDPIRKDRDWLQITGYFIVKGRPLPEDFDGQLDEVDSRALEALPKLRTMVLEAFERHLRPLPLKPASKPLNRHSRDDSPVAAKAAP